MPSPAETAPGPAAGGQTFAARVAWRRDNAIVDDANRGVTVPEIAARLDIPHAEVRRTPRAALAERNPVAPQTPEKAQNRSQTPLAAVRTTRAAASPPP